MASRAKTPTLSARSKTPAGKSSIATDLPSQAKSDARRLASKSARPAPSSVRDKKSLKPKVRGILKTARRTAGSTGDTSSDSESDGENAAAAKAFFQTNSNEGKNLHVRFAPGTKTDSNSYYRKTLPSEDGLDAINWSLIKEMKEKDEDLKEVQSMVASQGNEVAEEEDEDIELTGEFKEVESLHLLLRSSKEMLYITLLTYEEQLIIKARELLFQSADCEGNSTEEGATYSDDLKFTDDLGDNDVVDPAKVAQNIIDSIEKLQPRFNEILNDREKKKSEHYTKVRAFQFWSKKLGKEVSHVVNPLAQPLKAMVSEVDSFPEFKVAI